MKAAADIIDEWQPDMGTELTDAQYHYLKIAINEARKECIEECAKRAKIIRYQSNPFQDTNSALANQQRDAVDKLSILNLIKELK